MGSVPTLFILRRALTAVSPSSGFDDLLDAMVEKLEGYTDYHCLCCFSCFLAAK